MRCNASQTNKYLCSWAWSKGKGDCTTQVAAMPAKPCSPPRLKTKNSSIVRNRAIGSCHPKPAQSLTVVDSQLNTKNEDKN